MSTPTLGDNACKPVAKGRGPRDSGSGPGCVSLRLRMPRV